jgi:hypothetical protein
MKTSREILFEHHRPAESKLDAVRKAALSTSGLLSENASASTAQSRPEPFSWRELVSTFRWHLAGMSAAWFAILLLNANRSPMVSATIATQKSIPHQIMVAAVRENRRQLLEMIAPAESPDATPPKAGPILPRSDRTSQTAMG